MFNCQHCELATGCLRSLFKHYRQKHEASPFFRVQCVVPPCTKRYTSIRMLQRHILQRHRQFHAENVGAQQNRQLVHFREFDERGPNDVNDQPYFREEELPDEEPPENFLEKLPGPSEIKNMVATSLLSLREKYKLPANAVGAVANEVSMLVEISQRETTEYIQEALNEANIHIPEHLKNEFKNMPPMAVIKACSELDTQRKLESYLSKEMKFVCPEERLVANPVDNPERKTLQYIPIHESLKNMLQFEDVFREVQNRHVSQDGILRDFTDGQYFRDKPEFLQPNTLSLLLYMDEFTVTNPLRGRSKPYKIMGTYLMLGNLPPKYRSQLQTIQLVSLCQSIYVKKHGLDAVMHDVVEDLKRLCEDGIDIVRGNNIHHFRCEFIFVVGDNLAMHQIGGFMESFQVGKSCRFCMVPVGELRDGMVGPARMPESHDEQVAMVEANPRFSQIYGVKAKSVFGGIGSFHPVTSMPSDIAHDILGGVGKSLLNLLIHHCIHRGYFTLQEANRCLHEFEYKGSDKVNKPCLLTEKGEVKQTFSQMRCLMRLFPVIFGRYVPENDGAWEVMLILLRACEYIFAPALRPGHVSMMEDLINQYHEAKKETFPNEHLRPKDHFTLHYASQFIKFGPLVHLWTMRFEAKHNYFIEVFKS